MYVSIYLDILPIRSLESKDSNFKKEPGGG